MKNKFLTKAVAALLSIAMLVPMIPAAFAAQPSDFTDFPAGWSNEAMTAAVANGLLNGRTATTIEPQGNLTRAEMATIINRAFGAVKTADISQFHDVSASDWFYTEIAKAVNMQTFQGDGTGTMRPNSFITREEVFAVVARSLVLETSDFSALNSHPDGYNVADWAKPYASILSQKKYINGDSYGNLNPKSYITREEFAQIMHNIIKTYYTTSAMFNHSGASSSLIRTSGVTLSDVTINGDLIIGDGVGAGTVVLKNVIIKGRLLARGGEGSVTLTNTTVGEGVVVKDVNGIVHFNNYRTEAPFVGIREITKATFKNRTGSGSGPSVTSYTVTINGAGYTNKTYSVQSGKNFTFPTPNGAGHDAFAGWVLSTDTENKKVYEQGKPYKIEGNVTFVPVYYYNVEHWYVKLEGNSAAYNGYNYDKKATEKLVGRAGSEPTINHKVIKGFFYIDETKNSEKITESGLVVKVYYDRLDVYIDYVLSDGNFKEPNKHPKKVKFGAEITLPSIDAVECSYALERWYSNPSIGGINEFAPGSNFEINDYDDSTGTARIRLVAIWENTKFYNVQFVKGVDKVKTVSVPENGTVDVKVLKELSAELWSKDGYKEYDYISHLYLQDPYTHTVNANWYYKSNLNITPIKWEKFDSNIIITDDIADEHDIVNVEMKFPTITLWANIPKIFTKPYPRSYYYQEDGLTVDENGNPKKTGTRAADTIKDFLWDWFAPENRDLTSNKKLYSYIEKAGDKAFVKLREMGILGSNNEILDQSFTVKFASFVDKDLNKANIRKFIIDKSKEALKDNDSLHDAIIEYFEHIADTGDAQAKDDLAGLIEGTVKKALSDGNANTENLVEEMCKKSFSKSETINEAIKDTYDIDDAIDIDPEGSAKEFIEDIIGTSSNINDASLKATVSEIFGFVPDNFTSMSTKELIAAIIMDMPDGIDREYVEKRDKMIHFAVVEIIENDKIDVLDGYVTYAIEHLRSLDRLDETIDGIIAMKYEDTIDTIVDELVEGKKLTIQPEVNFVLEAIQGMVGDYSYQEIKKLIVNSGVSEQLLKKVFEIYPESKLMEIYNEPYEETVRQIEEGLKENNAGREAQINAGMTFVINPVADIYDVLYDTNFHRFIDKAKESFYYDQNKYLQELLTMTSSETFFDGSEAEGYRLKSYIDYYDIMLRLAIIGDDAINWYTENLNEQQLDELVHNYEDFFVEKANLLADMLEKFADTGYIPDKLDGVLEWYKTSPLNKEYGSGDYEYIRKAVNKAFNGIDITTDEVFDLLSKLCDTAAGKYDDIGGIHDKIVKLDANTYEVTIKGKTLTLERINDNEFVVRFEGKAVKLLRKFDDGYGNYCESYQIHFEGNYIELRRDIEG